MLRVAGIVVLGMVFAGGFVPAGMSQDGATVDLPTSRTAPTAPEGEEPLVIDVTGVGPAAKADKILVGGVEMTFASLHEHLKTKLGPANPKNRMEGNPRLSKHAVLIRCDRGQAFDYVKAILQVCAGPEVAVSKIRIAVAEKGRVLPADLPTDFATSARPMVVDPEFVTITLWQAPPEEDLRPLRERETRFGLEADRLEGTPASVLVTLKKELLAKRAERPEVRVKLDVRLGVPHQRVVEVLDVIRLCGIKSTTFVGMATNAAVAAGDRWWNRVKRVLAEGKTSEPRLRETGRGRRRVVRRRPGPQVGVSRGSDWLTSAQNQDGSWGATPDAIGPTSLALLSYLGAGHTHKIGQHRKVVRNGLKWLRNQQQGDGSFAPDARSHALGTLAMCEAYALTKSPLFKAPAAKSVERLVAIAASVHAVDAEVLGWTLLAARSAESAGVPAAKEGLQSLRARLAERTDAATGRAVGDERLLMTSVSLLARIFDDPDETVRGQARALLGAKLPAAGDDIDMPYRFFGTVLSYQVGGELWRDWNAAMKDAIIATQKPDGEHEGSWDPLGPSVADDRVSATALMTLCVEIYYRYGRVIGAR